MEHKLIIIDGPVGVGKTSIITELSKRLNALVVPEYIEEQNGVDKLNEYLSDKSKHAYEFQLYILNHYRDYIRTQSFIDALDKTRYVIIERDPLKGITFFARKDLNENNMSLLEYNDLYIEAVNVRTEIKETLNDLSEDNIVTIDTSNQTIDEIVNDIISNHLDADEIRLTAASKILYSRINKRNREGEISAYDMNYINYMVEYYFH